MLLQAQLDEGLGRLMHLLLILPGRQREGARERGGNSIKVLNAFAWNPDSGRRNSLIGDCVVAVLAVFGTQRRVVAIIVNCSLEQAGHGEGFLGAESLLLHANLDSLLGIGGAIDLRRPQAIGSWAIE